MKKNSCPLYPGDTSHLSLLETGAYFRLFTHYSSGGPLPKDLPTIYRITGATTKAERAAAYKVLDEFFRIQPDGLIHHRGVDEELARLADRHEKLSAAGKKRWHKPGLSRAAAGRSE